MSELKRSLGYTTIIALAVASIMGTGMFFGAGIAPQYSGNASLLAWVILAIFSMYIAACFGELSSMFPEAGGVYEFCKQAYGRFFSFIIGWTTWLVGNITTSLVVVAAVNLVIPSGQSYLIYKILTAVAIIILLNYISFLGVDASAATLILLSIITFALILALVVPGLGMVSLSNFEPFFKTTGLVAGMGSVFVTIFFIAESFFGWESVTFLSEETNNPQKIIPKSLILATAITAFSVIAVNFVSLGIIPWEKLIHEPLPFLAVAAKMYDPAILRVLAMGIFVTLINSAFGGAVTMPRLILALSRDRLFLSQFSKIHPTRNTPYKAIVFQTVVSLMILGMGFGSYFLLLNLLLPLGFTMYSFVLLSVPILRTKFPNMERPFKVIFPRIGPVLSVIFIGTLFMTWILNDPGTSVSVLKLGFSLILFGFPLYFLISLYHDPEMITGVSDLSAYLNLFTEPLTLPHSVRKEIVSLLGGLRGKKVLEYGCGVGSVTVTLAKEVGPEGRIFALDLSRNHLKITQKRLEQMVWLSKEREHARVTIVHDKDLVYRLHPGITYADAIVSVGMLGYIQDIEKMLHDFYKIIPNGGKICFVEYGDFFKVIPNVEWLVKNDVVEEIFRRAGFSVRVLRKKGLFWNYIYVYGFKSREQVTII